MQLSVSNVLNTQKSNKENVLILDPNSDKNQNLSTVKSECASFSSKK